MNPNDSNSAPAASLSDQLFAIAQGLLPKHLLSRWMYALMRQRGHWLRTQSIKTFLRNYRVDMSEALQSNPLAYESFNAFFTRALKPQARPVDQDELAVVSPVDGTVSQCGPIDGDLLIQAKGHQYSLLAMLGGDAQLARRYQGGHFACIYLAPYNYHRMHMPLTGSVDDTIYVPGELFSVNAATARTVPGLFARNERVVCNFAMTSGTSETTQRQFAMVFVGALFVGSIETVWAGEINPLPRRQGAAIRINQGRGLNLVKGAEAGRFNMGSTVVLVFEPGHMQWDANMQAGATLRMGQRIGTLQTHVAHAAVDVLV
ncbi:MAG: archaetidylserine decarboxylase [Steroidobacteraceae bacterium]